MKTQSMQKVEKKGPVYLHFEDGQVFVTPQDYDNFMIAARPAIEALRHAVNAEVWVKTFFEEYIPFVHRWCRSRADKIKFSYVTLPSGGPSLKAYFVVQGEHDLRLGEEIAKLELDLEDKGWPTDVMQLPITGDEDDLQTFFNPENSIRVYAEDKTAPGKVG